MFLKICEIIFKCMLSPFLFLVMLFIWFWFMLKLSIFNFLEIFSFFLEWFKEGEVFNHNPFKKKDLHEDLFF